MSSVSASKALAYATSGRMFTLYAVVVAGWVLTVVGQFLALPFRPSVGTLLGLLVALAGAVGVLVGLVAIAYKLLADSRTDR